MSEDTNGNSREENRPHAPSLFDAPGEAGKEESASKRTSSAGRGASENSGAAGGPWPPQDRFPLNRGTGTAPEKDATVGAAVGKSYDQSSSFTIVTAFTSLEQLLSFFSRRPVGDRQVDIVFGNAPQSRQADLYAQAQPIEAQAREYWLQRGVSVLTGGGAARLLQAIEQGQVRFYAARNLHAKIYVGDDGAIVGSSNFSAQGLEKQKEANTRFVAGTERCAELARIARQFKREARVCTDAIADLIRDLLQPVRWEEALARGAAEILEGDWVERYPKTFRLLEEEGLWPHQRQAIAQGLWILDTRGSVLVADATGSGKTRVGTHLLYGLLNRLWSKGQAHRTKATVICPPQVTDNWSLEIRASQASTVEAISHGRLSQGGDKEEVQRQVRESNVLFIDEAHNFLSTTSERSKAVMASAADYTALLTATPINRGPGDLLRMIELLGLDNLTDQEFAVYKNLHGTNSLRNEEEEQLRKIVRQCTIRRTKQDLNRLVEEEPEGYADGETVYRFPEHICKTYDTCETKDDQALAREINERAGRLRGLRWLRTFQAPFWKVGDLEAEKSFVDQKIKGARGLAGHVVRSALQSSKAALLEAVYGTEKAARHVGLDRGLKTKSGNYIGSVEELRDDPPSAEANNNLEKASLPDWLVGEELEATIEREQRLLEEIGTRAAQLSDARAEARADKIGELVETEPVLLAFGAKPLTLHDLRRRLKERGVPYEVAVADGNLSSSRKKALIQKLGLDGGRQRSLAGAEPPASKGESSEPVASEPVASEPVASGAGAEEAAADGAGEGGKLVALCSDAMSEGLNLQRAASVLLLDTPSVIRIAEQRVGRIDRMDSPHDQIEVWWPDDSLPFQSAKRDLLIERYNVNERLMGNNIKLPDALAGDESFFEDGEERRSANLLIDEYKKHQNESPSDRLGDAFRPVRELVGLGQRTEQRRSPLIGSAIYDQIAGADASVWSRVSVRASDQRWGFFCLRGQKKRAPRWVLLRPGVSDSRENELNLVQDEWEVDTRLAPIAQGLRQRLPATTPMPEVEEPAPWDSVQGELEWMLRRVQESEQQLLSNKARHALELLDEVLYVYERKSKAGTRRRQVTAFLRRVLNAEKEPNANLHSLADAWLGVVQPRYVEQKRSRRDRDPIRLKDMEEPLVKNPVSDDALEQIARATEQVKPIRRRVAAAIVAAPFNEEAVEEAM